MKERERDEREERESGGKEMGTRKTSLTRISV